MLALSRPFASAGVAGATTLIPGVFNIQASNTPQWCGPDTIRIQELVRIIEDVYYFELETSLREQEYVYGVEVQPTTSIVLDQQEHDAFQWCGFREALELLKWEENKEALNRLHNVVSGQD